MLQRPRFGLQVAAGRALLWRNNPDQCVGGANGPGEYRDGALPAPGGPAVPPHVHTAVHDSWPRQVIWKRQKSLVTKSRLAESRSIHDIFTAFPKFCPTDWIWPSSVELRPRWRSAWSSRTGRRSPCWLTAARSGSRPSSGVSCSASGRNPPSVSWMFVQG